MVDTLVPSRLTGTEFERIVQKACERLAENGVAHITRYGVQAVRRKEDWQILQSLPDFEGVLAGGQQTIFDCKVCSQASFSWDKYRAETKGARSRQLVHMRKRSRFGARCFFLMHWNERTLTKKTIPAQTWVLPVDDSNDYWSMVDGGVIRTLSLRDCQDMGQPVNWLIPDRCRNALPWWL